MKGRQGKAYCEKQSTFFRTSSSNFIFNIFVDVYHNQIGFTARTLSSLPFSHINQIIEIIDYGSVYPSPTLSTFGIGFLITRIF